MARTFKFSFPLPSRKQNDDAASSLQYDVADLPRCSPGSKAEWVLGPSESGVKGVRKPSGGKKKGNDQHPSYMSVTVREADVSLQASKSTIGKPYNSLPSSPLPRNRHRHKAAEWETRSATDMSGIPPRSQSSSTLQSYYDSSKSPLSVSQQTSASSARDMALRKGFPSIVNPVTPKVSDVDETLPMRTGSENVKPKGRPKHLHLHFGLSFRQKLDGPIKPLLSPNHLVRSPSPTSMVSEPAPSGPRSRSKRFLWERKMSKDSVSGGVEGSPAHRSGDEMTPVATRAPSETPPSAGRNRLDWDFADQIRSGSLPPSSLSHSWENSVNQTPVDPTRRHRLGRSKSSISDPNEEQDPHGRPRTGVNSTLPPSDAFLQTRPLERPRDASQAGEPKSRHRAKASFTMIFSHINIHEHSFLALTSSDEENDEGEISTDAMSRRHRIRLSVDQADTGEDVVVCHAQRLAHVKPRPVLNPPRRLGSYRKRSDPVPPVPSIPEQPPINPRISSIRWREETSHVPADLDTRSTPDPSRASSRTSHSDSRGSPLGSRRKPPGTESKLMAVTAEEEKLLEAMRRKRASIRPDASEDPVHDLHHLQCSATSGWRPQTAAGDERSDRSDFHGQPSISPSRASRSAHGRLRISVTASPDGIDHNELSLLRSSASSCRCSACASSLGAPHRASLALSDSGASIPHLSFNPSDILPSTPAMSDATGDEMHGAASRAECASPLTPPLDESPVAIYATELTVEDLSSSPVEPMMVVAASATAGGERGHDRKRPLGSPIVVVDGTGHDPRTLVEENGLMRWGMDRW